MTDLLGEIFRALTELGGGSEMAPLIAFCVMLVLLGLGLGLIATKMLRHYRGPTDPRQNITR